MPSVYITPTAHDHMQVIGVDMSPDTCQRLVHTPASGDYGYGKPTYPAGSTFACQFDARPVADAMQETAVPMVDADLYYAASVTLNADDRVKITYINGVVVASPQTYAIVEGPVVDLAGMRVGLKLVTDES